MKWKPVAVAGLAALALASSGAWGASEDERAAKELEHARKEVEKARDELRDATRELARSLAKAEKGTKRGQYFSYITDPDRPMLGIIIGDEEEDREERGLRVLAVSPGGGADKAGLKAGDLILAVNGKSLAADGEKRPRHQLHDLMSKLKAGDEIKVEYERDGNKKTVMLATTSPDPDLTLGPLMLPSCLGRDLDLDLDLEALAPLAPMFMFKGSGTRGLQLARLDDDLAYYFKTKEGVLVIKAPKSDSLDLRSGDVIRKINGQSVEEPVTVHDLLHGHKKDRIVKLEVMRRGEVVTVEGKLPVAMADPHKRKVERRVKVIVEEDDGT